MAEGLLQGVARGIPHHRPAFNLAGYSAGKGTTPEVGYIPTKLLSLPPTSMLTSLGRSAAFREMEYPSPNLFIYLTLTWALRAHTTSSLLQLNTTVFMRWTPITCPQDLCGSVIISMQPMVSRHCLTILAAE